MKHLKMYENYLNSEENQIHALCYIYGIKDYVIHGEYVDVNGPVLLSSYKLNKIPLKFGRVNGNFNCYDNSLTSLKNSPRHINGPFSCNYNRLTTLLEGPINVKNIYDCRGNNLKDVYGFPEFFSGELIIIDNPVYEILKIVLNYHKIRGFNKVDDIYENDKLLNKILIRFIRLLNEFKVIRNQDTIIESRLIDTFYEIGMKPISSMRFPLPNFKNYKLV